MTNKNKTTYAISKRQRTGILTICLLLAAFFIWLDHSHIKHQRQSHPSSAEPTRDYDFQKYHAKTFTVIKVVDGDTIDIDIPNREYNRTRIRLWGVDTPETKKPNTPVQYFGPEAAEYTTKLTLGKKVTVYLDEGNRTRDKYDRLLAYIKLQDGRFLNEVLVHEGFAYSDLRFRHSFYNKYKQLEASARNRKKGLWQKVTIEQMPEWRQQKSNIKNQNAK